MPSDTNNDLLYPKSLVIPKITEAIRDTLKAEEGTLIYNLDTNTLNICDVDKTVGATSWGLVTTS